MKKIKRWKKEGRHEARKERWVKYKQERKVKYGFRRKMKKKDEGKNQLF